MKVIVILNTDVVDLQLDKRNEFTSLCYCYVHVLPYIAQNMLYIRVQVLQFAISTVYSFQWNVKAVW